MNAVLSIHWFLAGAFWYAVNGILHDIFVIRAHKGPYDRELLRLLMDGHVLILSGLLIGLCWFMLRDGVQTYAALAGLIIATGMIAYCLMIFPFLKSFVTLGISLALVFVSVKLLLQAQAV